MCEVNLSSQARRSSTPSSTKGLTSDTPTLVGCSVLGSTLPRTRQRATNMFTGSEVGRAARCTKTARATSATGNECASWALLQPSEITGMQCSGDAPLFYTTGRVRVLVFKNSLILMRSSSEGSYIRAVWLESEPTLFRPVLVRGPWIGNPWHTIPVKTLETCSYLMASLLLIACFTYVLLFAVGLFQLECVRSTK